MAHKNIHGIDVEYTEESDTVIAYLEHLENRLSGEEMRAFMESAKHNEMSKVHLEDSHGDRVTFEYISDDSCLIRKRNS